LLAHGQWFSPGTSTTKTGCDDIAEILLKAALNTINQISKNTLNELSVLLPSIHVHFCNNPVYIIKILNHNQKLFFEEEQIIQ
jgi:hypothetical protein